MKKMPALLVMLLSLSFIYAGKKVTSIRDVVFEPRSEVIIDKNYSISIPDAWTRETSNLNNDKVYVSYIFADRKPEFAPSVMIRIENDRGDKFESIKELYMKRVFGDNAGKAVEQPALYKFMDKNASKQYAVYGSNQLAGNSFLCLLHYPDIKKTVTVIYALIYLEKFNETEWDYVINNSMDILLSLRRI